MKRYRILRFDFDTRSNVLQLYKDKGELNEMDKIYQQNLEAGLKQQYGEYSFEQKMQNFLDIGAKSFSVIAFHNKFLEQIRNSFIIGSYYPALTGACALGERILNHLILNLREDFKNTPEYKIVSRKASFDKWETANEVLTKWGILLPKTTELLKELKVKRNKSIHFNQSTETNDRQEALDAVKLIQDVIEQQFCAFGDRPWFIVGIPGEIYIKKEWEQRPYIKLVYHPNSKLLGYRHNAKMAMPWKIDDVEYEDTEITDDEFVKLRKGVLSSSV